MTDNPLLSTCLFCRKQFEAHPDSFVEVGYTAMHEDDLDDGDGIIDLDESSDYHLMEQGIEPEMAEKLRTMQVGDEITTGAAAVCDSCLNSEEWTFGPEQPYHE